MHNLEYETGLKLGARYKATLLEGLNKVKLTTILRYEDEIYVSSYDEIRGTTHVLEHKTFKGYWELDHA